MRWTIVVGLVVALGSTARAKPGAAIVVVIDRSLPADKLEVVTAALADAVGSLDPKDRLAVVSAGPTPSIDVRLQAIGAQKLAPVLGRIGASEKANLVAALDKAAAITTQVNASRRSVLIVTDSTSLVSLHARTMQLADKGVVVSTIGFQSANDLQLRYLAAIGRGLHHEAASRDELVDSFTDELGLDLGARPRAVVLLLDRSGSMEGPKFEATKQAASAMIETLSPNDFVGVIAFDDEAQVVVPLQRAASRLRIRAAIDHVAIGGRTNLFPALMTAQDMLIGIEAVRKTVLVLTDGESPAEALAEKVADMRQARIIVSAVGLSGADRNLLSMIADVGGGRLYMVEDLGALPKVLIKEASSAP